MRLGLLSDIHENVAQLRAALALLAGQGMDRLVLLGDVCDYGERLPQTVAVLREVGAEGVWGNHDFGVCVETAKKFRKPRLADTVEFMKRLRGQVVIEGCLFSHVEPWLDPTQVEEIWYFEGPPDTAEKLQRSFAAVPEGVLFMGHMHRWLHGTPEGPTAWAGEGPITLAADTRHLVVIHAVTEGRCAVYDTATRVLTPFGGDNGVVG